MTKVSPLPLSSPPTFHSTTPYPTPTIQATPMARLFRSAAALAMLAFAGLAAAETPMRRAQVRKGRDRRREGGKEDG